MWGSEVKTHRLLQLVGFSVKHVLSRIFDNSIILLSSSDHIHEFNVLKEEGDL